MPRQPRLDLAGVPQHVVQRGNDRQPCFFQDIDHVRYLDELREICLRERCAVHAYVLMTNGKNGVRFTFQKNTALEFGASGSDASAAHFTTIETTVSEPDPVFAWARRHGLRELRYRRLARSVPRETTPLFRHAVGSRGARATMVQYTLERTHRSATTPHASIAGSTQCAGMKTWGNLRLCPLFPTLFPKSAH